MLEYCGCGRVRDVEGGRGVYGRWVFEEGVNDRVGKYNMAVIQMVAGGVISKHVKAFNCVEVSTSLLVLLTVAKEGTCSFICANLLSVAVTSECMPVFVVTYCETPAGLSNIGLLTVRVC